MSNQPEKSLEEKVTEFVTCVQRRNLRETVTACAVFAGVWWLNLKAAKQLERDRDAWFGNSRVGSHKLRGVK